MKLARAEAVVCGERLSLQVFASEERALEHVRKHVLDPEQRWEAILGPLDPGRAAALYEGYAREIAAGLAFGAQVPCHMHLETEGAPRRGGEAFCFLSWRGVRIFADRARVRTAYRAALRKKGHQDYAYFARAWFDMATRASAVEREREGGAVERARRVCMAGGSDGLPPSIVEWRAMAARGGGA